VIWLRILNPAILAIYVAALFALGLRFFRRQRTTDRYFMAGRNVPGWLMGISLLATIITSVTFIAYPGAAYEGNWALLTPGMMILALPATLGLIVVPFFRHLVGMSAFEYFGMRFGPGVRMYCAATFAIGHLCKIAFVLYLLALTVNSMTGWSSLLMLAITAMVGILYAFIGGFEAILWADVIQGVLLWIGVLLAIGFLLYQTPARFSAVFQAAWQAHKFSLGSTAIDFRQPTVVVLLIYGSFFYLQKYTADQTVVQRYLAARSDRQALRGILLGALLCIPVWVLFMLAGTLLWGYYHFSREPLPPFIARSDQVFPYFLSFHLPPGAGGLFLAALFGAGMAMLSSDLNCLAAVLVRDFYQHWRPAATDRQSLRMGRWLVLANGILALAGAWTLGHTHGTILALYYAATSIVAGGLAGLFLLAFLSRRATRHAAWMAIGSNLAFTFWATLTSGKHPLISCRISFFWHEYMIGAVGQLLVVAIGWIASRWMKVPKDGPMTLWKWLRSSRQPHPPQAPLHPHLFQTHELEKL
jgi:SSS family solute:Na+ symporter